MDKQTLDTAVAQQRTDRNASYTALVALEDALEMRIPGREDEWKSTVTAALDALIAALNEQAEHNRASDSLFSRIASEQPRFIQQIAHLGNELDELQLAEQSLRDQIAGAAHAGLDELRSQLAALDSRYRLYRARETDLIYEATTVDLGGKG